jgi:hypothetical protein
MELTTYESDREPNLLSGLTLFLSTQYVSDGLLALGVLCRSGHRRTRPWPKHSGPIRIDGGLDGALQPASLRTLKTAQYRRR